MEIFSIIKYIVISIAAATTAFVAYKGLEKWQKELKGKANFDTARSLIRATYKLRDEVESSRSPFIPDREFPEDYDPLSKKTHQQQGDVYAHIYGKRWEPISEAMQDFDAYVLESEALWGPHIKEKTDALRSCIVELRVAIDALVSNKYSGGKDFFEDIEFGKTTRTKVSNTNKDKNPLTLKINSAIKSIEIEIRPHLDCS